MKDNNLKLYNLKLISEEGDSILNTVKVLASNSRSARRAVAVLYENDMWKNTKRTRICSLPLTDGLVVSCTAHSS